MWRHHARGREATLGLMAIVIQASVAAVVAVVLGARPGVGVILGHALSWRSPFHTARLVCFWLWSAVVPVIAALPVWRLDEVVLALLSVPQGTPGRPTVP